MVSLAPYSPCSSSLSCATQFGPGAPRSLGRWPPGLTRSRCSGWLKDGVHVLTTRSERHAPLRLLLGQPPGMRRGHVRRRVRARASPLLRAAGAEHRLARAQARPGTGSGNGRDGGVERRPASHVSTSHVSTSQRARASARARALFDLCVPSSGPVLSNACPLRGQPCSGPRRPPTAGRFGSEPEARDRGGGRQQCLARKRLPFPWKHQRS